MTFATRLRGLWNPIHCAPIVPHNVVNIQSYVSVIGTVLIVFCGNNPLGHPFQEKRLGIALASMKIEGN